MKSELRKQIAHSTMFNRRIFNFFFGLIFIFLFYSPAFGTEFATVDVLDPIQSPANDGTVGGVSVLNTAIGSYSDATGYESTAIGSDADATGPASIAIGHESRAVERGATATGSYSGATA